VFRIEFRKAWNGSPNRLSFELRADGIAQAASKIGSNSLSRRPYGGDYGD